ncbi:MAG: ABC transporter permease [Acidobacteriaceae bacterium]|nr:ABC transporter permease [Acidobacteriaceae bacterium]MBV8572681.1 ABC transporter permease [Acidobacteriaceae bacterium]
MMNLVQDLRYSLRAIHRSPLFASIAILSLALGIGANTAIFTVMDQLMLRELPVKNPGQLVMLYQHGPHNGSNMGDRMNSYPIYQDFQKRAAPLSEVLCRRLISASVSIHNHTERVGAEMVSGNYFTMLGVRPAAGRLFRSDLDDRVYAGQPVVVLSYDYWVNRFDRDPRVVGEKILVNNYPMTVVGVSARGFLGFDPARAPQIRVPILMEPVMAPEWFWFSMGDRRTRWVQMFGRLKPGYTIESAQPPLQVLFHQIREYECTLPAAKDWSAFEKREFLKGTIQLEKAKAGYSDLRNSFSTALIVLMCMVGLVLLIACANVANLLIARAFARQKEVAVRLSIGASRAQLIHQLLVESMVLSFAGGAAGIGLAVVMTRSLLALMPAQETPLLIQPYPDLRILLFTLALTFLTGLIFGLVPAVRASQPDLWTTLKDAAGSIAASGGSLFLRKGLVATQVALSFLLLFGAGLFVRSLQNLRGTPTGFRDIDNLVTFQLSPALNGYGAERTVYLYDELLTNIRAIPGVKAVGLATDPLLSGDEWDSTTSVEGHQAKDGEDMQAFMNAISPGYFETMGIPLMAGRDFDRRDMKDNAKVAIVNERFARHFFGNKSAIGRHIGRGMGPGTKIDIEIVGVVGDSLFEGPREGVHRQVFVPNWGNQSAAFYVRTERAAGSMYPALKQELKKLDPSMPMYQLKTLGRQLDETLLTERLVALLSAGFGLLATLLAAIGLYGVMAFVVTRRTKEMGVRMALGANAGAVIWLVMREVVVLLAIGLAIGVPAALALGRFIATQLYGIKASDPEIAAFSMVTLVAVAAIAGLIPARRASRIDPILALRYE